MGKRLKATLPSKPSSTAPLKLDIPQDPRETPSRSTLIMDGAEDLPKGAILAKDAKHEILYVNYEKESKLVKLLLDKTGKLNANKQHLITFYSGPDYGWLETTVPFAYPIIRADHEDAPEHVKPIAEEDLKEKRRAAAAHLPKFQKTKPDPTPEKASGKKVFKGKLNGKNVLFDAGDGSTVAVLEPGTPLADGAKKVKRELVSQKDATAYAVWVFTKQWAAQK